MSTQPKPTTANQARYDRMIREEGCSICGNQKDHCEHSKHAYQPKPTSLRQEDTAQQAGEWTVESVQELVDGHTDMFKAIADSHNATLAEATDAAVQEMLLLKQQLAAEREKVEQLRESHACLFSENERLRERGWPDYPTDSTYRQLREQLADELENVTLATQMVHIESKRANEAEQKMQPLVDALKDLRDHASETYEDYEVYARCIARQALAKVKK